MQTVQPLRGGSATRPGLPRSAAPALDWRRAVFGGALACAALWSLPASAGTPDAAAVQALRQQMKMLQQQMQKIQQQLDRLDPAGGSPAPAPGPAPTTAGAGPACAAGATIPTGAAPLAGSAAAAAAPAPSVTAAASSSPSPSQPWSPSQPIQIFSAGSAYMNISFDTIVNAGTSTDSHVKELELGDHDPDQRGFSLRNAELALDGAVDPYFKAFANVVFKLDDGNETSVELEEAYALSTSLPWNLQVKAGQYFAEFGRQNQMHPHTWAFVDEPLIMGRVLGGDGLRNVGARLSWLAPTPFYTEVFLSVMNGEGGTATSFRDTGNTYGRTPVDRSIESFSDLLFVPRIASSFDLTDNQTLVVGASGAFGPNDSGTGTYTQLYGTDVYWKWTPDSSQQGFPFVAFQSEAMLRRYEAGEDPTVPLPRQDLDDYGFYAQVLWGLRLGWVAALRGEYAAANDSSLDEVTRGDRARISPNLTWYPTEFSKLRLQYNYDHREVLGDEHSVWLQLEFTLGAHGAHRF